MSGSSVDVTARIYHTVDGVPHNEGETYAVTDRALADTLRAIGFVTIVGWTEAPIVTPAITALAPDTAAVGAADFALVVTGTGLAPDSVIVWNGADVATTVTSDTEVTAPITTPAAAGPIPVQVRAGGNLSNVLTFTVSAARSGDPTPPTPKPRTYGRAA